MLERRTTREFDLPTASDETGGGGGNNGGEHGGKSWEGSTPDDDDGVLLASTDPLPDPLSISSVSKSTWMSQTTGDKIRKCVQRYICIYIKNR